MDSATLSLLAQVPVVAAVIWFTLHILKIDSAERMKRDQSWQGALASVVERFMERMNSAEQTHEQAMLQVASALADLRTSSNQVLGLQIAQAAELTPEEVKKMVDQLAHRP